MRAPRGGGRRCPHPARLGIRPRSGNRGVARAAGPGTGPPGYARRQARDRLPACGGIVRLTSTGTAESTDVASARPQPGPRLAAWQALLVAIAGGLALAAAFPPAGWWPLAAVGPALLAIALWRQRLRIALAAGLVFGLGFFFPLLSWLVNVAWYAWVALAVVEAIIFAVLTAGQWLLLRLRGRPRPVALGRLPLGQARHEPGDLACGALGGGGRPRVPDFPDRAGRRVPGLAGARI